MIQRVKNILRYNKLQKFTALVMSMILWVFVMSSQNPVIKSSYTVPVSVINSPREFSVTVEDKPITIELSAPRSYFIDYSNEDIHATVNLANLTEGEYEVNVDAGYPKGFEFKEISPDKLHVKLEPFVEKQIAAEVIVNGSTVPDSVVKGIAKSLETLTVLGAKSDVAKVQRVIGYVGLTNNKDDFDLQVPMSAIDADGRQVKGVRVVPSEITVNVDIETGIKKKVVPIKVNLTAPSGKEFSKITAEPAQIEIAGKEEIIKDIDAIQTTTLILPALENDFHGTLRLAVPDGVTVAETKVAVTAELKK